MTDEKRDEKDDLEQVDQSEANTLEEPREEDEGGEDQLDPVPDA
jgi:hypothetical protein